MKSLLCMVIGLGLLQLVGCVNPIGGGELEPYEAVKACRPKIPKSYNEMSSNFWEEDGHFWATLWIAEAANLNPDVALALTYYSQYPDIDHSYEAVTQAFKVWRPKWRKAVMSEIHSLHGGNQVAVKQRRQAIASILDESMPLVTLEEPEKIWFIGVLIHALGDAYAHTKGTFGEDEKAYGYLVGHAIPSLLGKSPDKIKRPIAKEKMINYAKKLYEIFDFQKQGNQKKFVTFIKRIKNCNENNCAFQGSKYRADPKKGKEKYFDDFKNCMNISARKLRKEEIRGISRNILSNGV